MISYTLQPGIMVYVFTISVVNRKGYDYGRNKKRPYFKKSLKFYAPDLDKALTMLDEHCMATMKFDEYAILYIYSEQYFGL